MSFKQKNRSLDPSSLRKNLTKIIEDPQEFLEDNYKEHKKHKIILSKLEIPPSLNFYETWLYTLSKSSKVYKFFTQRAHQLQILSKSKSSCLSPDSSFSFLQRNISNTSRLKIDPNDSLDKHDTTISQVSRESRAILYKSPYIPSMNYISALKNVAYAKILNIDKGSPEYLDRFKDITGTSGNVTRENLKDYLNKRYCAEVTETLVKWIYTGISANHENWVKDIQKFVVLPDEKHLKLAFDFYDQNKDRYICNGDAFRAISVDTNRCFSQDIIKISQKLEEKMRTENKQSPVSTKVSAIHKLRALYEERRNKVPSFYMIKPDTLNFEEFCSIQFVYAKPKIIIDLIEYVSGVLIGEFEAKPKTTSRRKSEEIVKRLSENYEFKEKLQTDPDYPYFLDLFNIMSYYTVNTSLILLQKFNTMICSSYINQKFLSLYSVKQHWGQFFGTDNEFINTSFYQFLAGYENYNISKISYLTKLKTLFQENTENFFSFCIYDRNKDGFITCDEIKDLLQSLPEDSFIYKECLILANEFIASIFGKRVTPVNKIEFEKFEEMIPKSIFAQVVYKKEFRNALLNCEERRKNLSFCRVEELSKEEFDYFSGFSHLNKKIELGEVTSDNVNAVEKK